jgi:hypothetical protein
MQVKRCQESDLSPDIINEITGDALFGSARFGRLWETVGGEAIYWAVYNNERVIALLPAVEFGFRPLKRLQAMPDGCYGRLYVSATAGSDAPAIAAALQAVLTEARYSKVFLYDYYGWCGEHRSYQAEVCVTSVVDISLPEWEPPDKKMQSEIRKAQREGIEVRKFAPADMDRFISLMQQAEAEHGRKAKYPREFFEALAALAEHDDRIQWLWCEHGGKAAASHINLIENDMVINWQVYFDRQFSFLKPNQFMLFHAARELAGKGVKYLNLGASPDEAENLRAYKKKWGGVERTYFCQVWLSALGKMI